MFFIIPVGHESSKVRRQPWVSYLVIALNILIYFAFTHNALENPQARRRWQETVRYALENPYTQLPGGFRRIFKEKELAEFGKARELLKAAKLEPDDDELAERQAHLDQLMEAFLELYNTDSYHKWGYIPGTGRPYTLVTHMFFHAGFLHLLGNLFVFFLCGPFVEDRMGRVLFSGLYLTGGAAAALCHGLLTPQAHAPLVGASGAVAVAMGAFLVLFFRTRIRFFYFFLFLIRPVTGTFRSPAFLVLPFWLAQQLLNAMGGSGSNVAFWAHVGGFVFGAVFASAFKLFKIEDRFISPGIEEQLTLFAAHPLTDKALREMSQGKNRDAVETWSQILRDDPRDVNALNALFEIHSMSADEKGVQRIGSALIKALLRNHLHDEAVDIYEEMKRTSRSMEPDAEALSHLAASYERSGDLDAAAGKYERLVQCHPGHVLALKGMLKLADHALFRKKDFRGALAYFAAARQHCEIDAHTLRVIENGIKQARELGGADLEGTEQPCPLQGKDRAESPTEIRIRPLHARLAGLEGGGLVLVDEKGGSHRLAWRDISLLSIAALSEMSGVPTDGHRPFVIIDLFSNTSRAGAVIQYEGFRLIDRDLPLEKLAGDSMDGRGALKRILDILHRRISCRTYPSAEKLMGFKLPLYGSPAEYERALCKKISKSLSMPASRDGGGTDALKSSGLDMPGFRTHPNANGANGWKAQR